MMYNISSINLHTHNSSSAAADAHHNEMKITARTVECSSKIIQDDKSFKCVRVEKEENLLFVER